MIVVTGGAGFIGSNIVKGLNAQGRTDILVVDDLTDGHKFKNLAGCDILDYLDKDDFLNKIVNNGDRFEYIETVFHQGACSATTEWDGRYMMKNNYEYSKILLNYCLERQISFIYASSAAVYGDGKTFIESLEYEAPINVYAYSKYLFDQYVRRKIEKATSQIIGLRYFNVYGPNERHKGGMASVALHLNNQLKESGVIKLFEGCDGYGNGEQRRDFIYVDDVVALNLWSWANTNISGIFNAGTGRSQPFNDVAKAILDWHGRGKLQYIPFPEHLKGAYQSFTEANTTLLRETGCNHPFEDVATGVKKYLDWLNQ